MLEFARPVGQVFAPTLLLPREWVTFWHPVMPCHVLSSLLLSCPLMSCHLALLSRHVMPCYIISSRVMFCRVMSRFAMLCDVMSCLNTTIVCTRGVVAWPAISIILRYVSSLYCFLLCLNISSRVMARHVVQGLAALGPFK